MVQYYIRSWHNIMACNYGIGMGTQSPLGLGFGLRDFHQYYSKLLPLCDNIVVCKQSGTPTYIYPKFHIIKLTTSQST